MKKLKNNNQIPFDISEININALYSTSTEEIYYQNENLFNDDSLNKISDKQLVKLHDKINTLLERYDTCERYSFVDYFLKKHSC